MNKEQAFNELPAYQQRMVNEYLKLNDRVLKLGSFIHDKSETYINLGLEEKRDLDTQYHAMVIYKMALYSRLCRAELADFVFPPED